MQDDFFGSAALPVTERMTRSSGAENFIIISPGLIVYSGCGTPCYFETDADLLYQDEIHGSILEQIDKIVELVYLKYMRAKITYEGMQRIERYFVPEEALREALLNALCHKQYQSGVPSPLLEVGNNFIVHIIHRKSWKR